MANKGAVKYTDLFASDVHYGLLELEEDFKNLDSVAQSFSKTVAGTKARIKVTIQQETKALEENKNALVGTDVAGKNAAATISKISRAVEENIKKTQILNAQQEILQKSFNASTASVDRIKDRVAALTKEYYSLGRATDEDKAKAASLATEIRKLKTDQDNLTSALTKSKKAIEVADGSYTQMSQRLTQLRKELRELPNAVNKATGEWNKANPAVARHLVEIEKLDRGIKKMDATMGQHQRNVGNYSGAIDKAGAEITAFLAGFISVAGAMTVATAAFDKAVEVDAIKTALEFIFKGTGDANERIQMLKDTSERLGLEFVALAGSYKSFAGAAVASNFPLKEADRLFQSVANASSKLKLSSEQTEGALNALQQMISKGNVQAEELRGQLGERIPGAFAIAARAMGVTEQQLNKMLKDGDVLASELLPKLATELDKTFDNDKNEKIDSLQSYINRLKNTFSLAVEEGNISAFFKVIVDGTQNAASALNKLVNSGSWKEFFARSIKTAAGEGSIGGIVGGALGDAFAMEEQISKMTDFEKVISKFRAKSQKEQLESIRLYAAGREKALATAKGTGLESDIVYANTLTKTLRELSKIYSSLYKTKAEGTETEAEREKRLKAEQKAQREAEAAAKRAEAQRQKAIREANDLLKAQTKIKVAQLDLQLADDLSSGSEEDKVNILVKYEKDKLSIIQDGTAQRKRLFEKSSSDYSEIELERVNATATAEENINKAIEDGLKRKLALAEKYKKLDDELSDVQEDGKYDKALFDINNTKFKGTPQEQDQQRQEAIYNLRRDDILKELVLVDLKFNHIQDAAEREKEIAIEKARLINLLNKENYDYTLYLNEQTKESYDKLFSFMQENTQIIGQLFGSGFENFFASITTDLQTFLENGKLGFEDWANTAKAAMEMVANQFTNASEARITALEGEKERELELAGDNKEAKEKIETEYNNRIKEEKRKQAKADRAAALFSIAINTAMAVASVLSTGGGTRYADFGISAAVLSALVIGTGAAQAALVLSKPLPEYYVGTEDAKPGPAHISERGPEIVKDKKTGKMRLFKEHSIVNMKGGEIVFTAAQTEKILRDMDLQQNTNLHADLSHSVSIGKRNQEVSVMAAAMQLARTDEKKIGEEVGKQIAELPINNWSVDERGFTKSIRKGNTTITQLNNKYSLK